MTPATPCQNTLDVGGLQRLFVGLVCAGAILSALTSLFEIKPWTTMVASILIMGFYWLQYRSAGEPLALRETFADSAYYLGFLQTIISLLTSMIAMSTAEGDRPLSAHSIIGGFGFALVTTLMGLLIRCYYRQFELSDQSARQIMQADLETVVRDFNIQVRNVSGSLDRMLEVADSTLNGTVDRFTQTQEQIGHYFERVQKESEKMLHGSVSLRQAQCDAGKEFEAIGTVYKALVDSLGRRMDSMAQHDKELSVLVAKRMRESKTCMEALSAVSTKEIHQSIKDELETWQTLFNARTRDMRQLQKVWTEEAAMMRASSQAFSTQMVDTAKFLTRNTRSMLSETMPPAATSVAER